MKRTLSLKRETLSELTTAELADIFAGGPTDPQPTPPQHIITYTCFDSNLVCTGPTLTRGSSCDYC